MVVSAILHREVLRSEPDVWKVGLSYIRLHVGLLRFGRNRVSYPRDGARVFRVMEKGAVHRPYGGGVF